MAYIHYDKMHTFERLLYAVIAEHALLALKLIALSAFVGQADGASADHAAEAAEAAEAAAAGIVNEALPLEALTEAAMVRVAPLAGTAGDNLATIKRQLYPLITGLVDG